MENLITEIDILDESKDNFLTYAEEVLTDRAIPSAEDGLLSVHRKLLWTMKEVLGMTNKTKYKKSASVVGSTLASSYFHGDTACYGALCKLAQSYLMRYPLIDGDGNLGTQEGNGMEAAARYTNCRPSKYADLMMEDFKKNVVPLKETYNGEYMEPIVLPSLLPNAIVNGRESIGISMSHNSLPNNLSETCDAIIARLNKNSSLTIDELMQYMKGPDFPLENTIINSKDIKQAYRTGKSTVSLKVRGKYEIKENNIIFNTIPYRTYRNKIKEQINKNIDILSEYIEDFSDESNVGVNKLVFKVKKGLDPEQVVLKLFSLTSLQTTLSYNMNYIVNGTPKMCSMMDLIDAYVIHQIKVLLKATEYDKEKAEARKHILEGLILIITNIDKAINLIRSSIDKKEAETKLIEEFYIDEIQAKAVLDMKLSKLTKLDKDDLIKELEEKKIIIAECNKIISDEFYRNNKIIEKITQLKNKYGDARRTELLNIEVPKEEKVIEEIIPEDCVVILSQSGNIKRIPKNNFKTQNRNGKGIKTKDDVVMSAISTNTIDNLFLFTKNGKMFKLKVNDIPIGTNLTKGSYVGTLINLDQNDTVIAITSSIENNSSKYAVFFTKKGFIKKTNLEEYMKLKRGNGLAAIKLNEGDSIANVEFMNNEDVLVITKNGMSIHFETKSISAIGRVTAGVKSIKLSEDDEVIVGLPINSNEDMIAIFSSKGYGKKTSIKEFLLQTRGGKGLIIYKPTENYGNIAGATIITNNNKILLTGQPNSICISVADLPLLTRTSLGNIMVKSNISSVVKI